MPEHIQHPICDTLSVDPSVVDGEGKNCLHYAFMHSAKGEIIHMLLTGIKSLQEYVLCYA